MPDEQPTGVPNPEDLLKAKLDKLLVEQEEAAREDDLERRFPTLPDAPHLPEVPRLTPILPPHPSVPKPGAMAPGSFKGSALAMNAVSSFVTPVLGLGALGWFLDSRFHWSPWAVLTGIVVGFILGVMGVLRVVNQLPDESRK